MTMRYEGVEMEKTSSKAFAGIATFLDTERSQQIWFGRNLGFRTGTESIEEMFLNSWLDGVYIFDAALEKNQIQKVMKSNQFD